MNLYEKMQLSEAGRLACGIGEVMYRYKERIDKTNTDRLSSAQAFLERIALDELRKLEPWAFELADKSNTK